MVRLRRHVGTLMLGAWLTVLSCSLWVISTKILQHSLATNRLLAPPPLVNLDTRLLNIITLGHRGLYDDISTIWLLQTLVDQEVNRLDPELLAANIKLLSRHQPNLESFYMISCFVLALELNRPDLCEPIIIDGIQALPHSWRIPLTQGFVSQYKLHDPKKGLAYYTLTARKPSAPKFIASLAQKMLAKNSHDLRDTTDLEQTLRAITGDDQKSHFKDMLQKSSGTKANP